MAWAGETEERTGWAGLCWRSRETPETANVLCRCRLLAAAAAVVVVVVGVVCEDVGQRQAPNLRCPLRTDTPPLSCDIPEHPHPVHAVFLCLFLFLSDGLDAADSMLAAAARNVEAGRRER